MKKYLKKISSLKVNLLVAIIIGSLFMLESPNVILRIVFYIGFLLFIDFMVNKIVKESNE